jgi:ATP-dependent Lhr-like helicase
LLLRLTEAGKLIEGEFRPGGIGREWVDADVLRSLRRRSLAALRHEIEPVDPDALGRFLISWHGIGSGRRGLEALLDAIEQLQGAAIPASVLEREVLPARVDDYSPAMLDTLMAAGEVTWTGVEPLGERDGRIALYLTDHMRRLRPRLRAKSGEDAAPLHDRARAVLEYLRTHGASFFSAIHEGTGGGFPNETVDALWDLVWRGEITNDTLHPLRAYGRLEEKRTARRPHGAFRSRRLVPPKAEGRWSAIDSLPAPSPRRQPTTAMRAADTEWAATMAQQLLSRHGIVTRETMAAESVAGGFQVIYEVLKAMDDAGRVRRGYFVAGLGAAQFAMPPALDLLRSMREPPDAPRTAVLAATDPANPYGTVLKWPGSSSSDVADESGNGGSEPARPDATGGRGATRSVGALVILVDGLAAGYLRRGERELLLYSPETEPRRSQVTREVARMLIHLAMTREEGRRGLLIAEINGAPATAHPSSRIFIGEGFAATALGLQVRVGTRIAGWMPGGTTMAETRKNQNAADRNGPERDGETSDTEHDRVRESNDTDQQLEREGITSRHNRGYDQAVQGGGGQNRPTDPDSAESDVDRDDTVED